MPVNTVADNDVLTASFWNANVRDQVVSSVTSGTRPAGTEVQIIGETDTDRLWIYSGSAWVQLGGYSNTALNAHTPQIDQGASSNIAKTVNYSSYQQVGNLCYWSFSLSLTAAGTAGSQVTLTTPVTMASTAPPVGGGFIQDNSTTTLYNGTWMPATTTTIRLFVDVATVQAWGANPNLALASGDVIRGWTWLPVA